VGGHVLHGGWGYSTHNNGLFLDYLEEVQVVTANSSVVTASKTQNPDLFWALRGAGMSFAIATRFKFRTIPQPAEIQLFYIPFVWNLPQAKAGWRIFQDYVASKARPKEMNIRVVLSSGAWVGAEGTIFLFEGAYHGSKADYELFIQPFKDAVVALGGFADFMNYPEVTSVGYMDSLLYANNNALLYPLPGAEPLESGLDDQIVSGTSFVGANVEALTDGSFNV
jgi:FAD/FMN-containing dehydrogenase